jgi:hypothetical protein
MRAGNRKKETGNRGAGNRKQETGSRKQEGSSTKNRTET